MINCLSAIESSRLVLCPQGYYCPDSESVRECPIGHYCPPGSITPTPCGLGASGCSVKGMHYPYIVRQMVLMFVLIIFGMSMGYNLFLRISTVSDVRYLSCVCRLLFFQYVNE